MIVLTEYNDRKISTFTGVDKERMGCFLGVIIFPTIWNFLLEASWSFEGMANKSSLDPVPNMFKGITNTRSRLKNNSYEGTT